MGLPFSKIIQNGQEYDISVPSASSYPIAWNTKFSDVRDLIVNSINKGFIPYVLTKTNDLYSYFQFDSLNDYTESIVFTRLGGGNSGGLQNCVVAHKLEITDTETTYHTYAVNKSDSATNTVSVLNMTLYYK